MSAKERINSLQAIRALAFLGIFLQHTGIKLFSLSGSWGASTFVLLSGFVMTYTYLDSDKIQTYSILNNLKFSFGKIKKLYSLHIVTMLMALPLLIWGYIDAGAVNWHIKVLLKMFLNVALVHSWIPSKGIYFSLNGVSWYLCASVLLYFCFPWILRGLRKYKNLKTAWITILTVYILHILLAYLSTYIIFPMADGENVNFTTWFVYIFPVSRLLEFYVGCNLGYIFIKRPRKNQGDVNIKYTILEVVAILVIIIQQLLYVYILPNIGVTVAGEAELWWASVIQWMIPTCLLIYLFALNKGNISKILTCKYVVYIGNISAYTFLIHQVVIRYIQEVIAEIFGVEHISNVFAVIVSFGITILLAEGWKRINRIKR